MATHSREKSAGSSAVLNSKDMSAYLSTGPVNLAIVREYYRQQLSDVISEWPGSKAVVLDKALEGHLNLIADFDHRKFLQSIEGVETLTTLSEEMFSSQTHLVYLCRPTIHNMRLIAGHILTHKERDKQHVYTLLLTPRKTMLCERELEEQGVKDDIGRISEFQLELIPLDSDVLSMEWDTAFRELYLDGDTSHLYSIARSLMKLQAVYGLIPVVKGKGNQAKGVWKLMQRMRRDWPIQPHSQLNAATEPISALLLVDRNLDITTPLLTPSTYEGLIDELFGIRFSSLDISNDMLETRDGNGGGSGKRKLLLTSNDLLYRDIRSLPTNQLGRFLHKRAQTVKDTYAERDTSMSVKELVAYMQKFKAANSEHFLLTTHINIAEKLSEQVRDKLFADRLEVERYMVEGVESETCEEYVESAIARQVSLPIVLRLLCVMSATSGIRSKKYDQWKRDIVQTYGYHHVLTLANLEKAGLLSSSKKASAFSAVRKQLRLVQASSRGGGGGAGGGDRSSDDIAYVYDGIAPLIVRLVEMAMRPGWKRMDEIMTLIPGDGFEYRQDGQQETVSIGHTPAAPTLPPTSESSSGGGKGLRGWLGKSRKGHDSMDAAATAAAASAAAAAAPAATSETGEGEGDVMKKKPVVLVMFIGGCTWAEVAALRHLSAKAEHDFEYIVATSKLTNGSTFVSSVMEQVRDVEIEKKLKRSIFHMDRDRGDRE